MASFLLFSFNIVLNLIIGTASFDLLKKQLHGRNIAHQKRHDGQGHRPATQSSSWDDENGQNITSFLRLTTRKPAEDYRRNPKATLKNHHEAWEDITTVTILWAYLTIIVADVTRYPQHVMVQE